MDNFWMSMLLYIFVKCFILANCMDNTVVTSTTEYRISNNSAGDSSVNDGNTMVTSTERNTDSSATDFFYITKTLPWFNTEKFYYYYGDIQVEDIEAYIQQNRTQQFLSTFESHYQREVITTQLRFCPFTSLCGFSFDLSLPPFDTSCCKECSCDFPACLSNKTCCPDIMFQHIDMFNSTAVGVQLPKYLAGQNIQQDCLPLALSKETPILRTSAFGFSACPLDAEAELSENCTRQYDIQSIKTISDTVPVINKETFVLYRNKYCAFCHGEQDSQIKQLQFRLLCRNGNLHISTDKDILNSIFIDENCYVEFLSEDDLDYCKSGRSECNITGSFQESVCSMYRSLIYVNKIPYQNVFCSMCNGYFPEKLTCSSNSMARDTAFSFSGLLKLDTMGSKYYAAKSTDKCSENQLYDTILDSCRDVVCSDISVLRNGECIDIFEKLEKITYTAFLRLVPVSPLTVADAYEVADDVINQMRSFMNDSYLCGMQMWYKCNITYQENEHFAILNSSLLYFEIRVQYHMRPFHDPHSVVDYILQLQETEHIFLSKNENEPSSFLFQVIDIYSRKFDFLSFLSNTDQMHNGIYYGAEEINALDLTTLLENYVTSGKDNLAIFPHIRINDDVGLCESNKNEFNILWLTTCPKVKISVSDVPWIELEDGMKFTRGDYKLNSTDYYYADENHIMICADTYKTYMTTLNIQPRGPLSVEAIVSIVCSVLSILALSFTFFIFCFFSKLRQTIPGKNNMSLIFALLSAQSLYLIGSFSRLDGNSIECAIFGFLIHYFWLVALFWMNVCTFHMFRVLARIKVVSQTSGLKRLVKYHFYALSMSAIFVIINIVVSRSLYGHIGYGGSTCYISSQRMIIYTFGIPAGLIIISNLSMFIYVIVRIKMSPEVQKNVQNERNDIIVFGKLSTITGATWVFGFLYTWTNVNVMSYLFILLNASQGVFIMFAFIMNKRVLNLFKCQVLGLTVTSTDSSNPTSKSFVNKLKSDQAFSRANSKSNNP